MNELLKQLGIGVAAVLIGSALVSFVPESVTTGSQLAVLNTQFVQFGLLTIVVYVGLSTVVRSVRSARATEPDSVFSTITARTEPDYVDTEWEVRKFGVEWNVLHGKKRDREGLYAYASGPLCPECGAELRETTVPHRLRSDEELWNCHGCSFSQPRPSDYLHKEQDVVETFVEEEKHRQPSRQSTQ